MRILITGGAGFIGSSLVRVCLEAGDEVRILDDFSTGRAENLRDVRDATVVMEGSVTDYASVEGAVRDREVVYHLAAQPSVELSIREPRYSHAVNVDGTLHVLEAARQARVRRVVFASSCALYGASTALPLSEDAVPAPLSPYALHKLIGELYCEQFTRLYALETMALRYFNVYGSRQDPESPYAAVVPCFMSAVASGNAPRIHGDGLQSRDFIHVDDVVAATRAAALAEVPAARARLNIGRGEPVSILQLFEQICRVTGRCDLKAEFVAVRPGDVPHSQADVSCAERVLGWRAKLSLAAGLERVFAHLTRRAEPACE